MPMIININLLLAACEYTSVSAERKDKPKSEITHCIKLNRAYLRAVCRRYLSLL